jgi:hypothetical protein
VSARAATSRTIVEHFARRVVVLLDTVDNALPDV